MSPEPTWLPEGVEPVRRPKPERRPGQNLRIMNVPRVYLEDIETIVYLISKHTTRIAIRTDEFKVKSPKQLRDIPKENISELVIRSEDPTVLVEFGRPSHRVITNSDDPEVQELVDEIVRVVSRRTDRGRKFLRTWGSILLLLV
jgi:hypothetical protein